MFDEVYYTMSILQLDEFVVESITPITKIDVVNLKAAYEMLPDAIGQTRLNASIGDEFASHILSRAAETLGNCLSNVGVVAEFANVTHQLEVLEN